MRLIYLILGIALTAVIILPLVCLCEKLEKAPRIKKEVAPIDSSIIIIQIATDEANES